MDFKFLYKNIHYAIVESIMDKVTMPVSTYDGFMKNCMDLMETDKDTKTFKYTAYVKDYTLSEWLGVEHSFIIEDKIIDMIIVYGWIEEVYRTMEDCPNKYVVELYVRALEEFLNELEGRLDEYYYVSLNWNNGFTRWRLRKSIDKDIDNGLLNVLKQVSARRLFRINPSLNVLDEVEEPV